MKLLAYRNSYLNQKMAKFIGIGLINTFFGYGIYAVLIAVKIPYLAALLLTTIAGVTFNYFSTGRLVFESSGSLTIFWKFIFAYGIGYVLNSIGLALLINSFETGPYLGQALCMPPSIVLSWLLLNHWVFKK